MNISSVVRLNTVWLKIFVDARAQTITLLLMQVIVFFLRHTQKENSSNFLRQGNIGNPEDRT